MREQPRFPAMKPFHGAVLHNPRLRSRAPPARHGPVLPAPSLGRGLKKRSPERLAGPAPLPVDAYLDDGLEHQMYQTRQEARDELLPLAGWSSHLRSSRQQFAIATPPPLPSPLASPVAAVSPRASPRRLMSDADVIYCPGSSARPEPLAHGGSAAAVMDTQPPVVQPLGGVGSAGRPALSFADSQDSLADITSSSALSRSVAVAPLPTYIKSRQKSRAPPPRAVVPMAKPGGLGSTSARRLRTSYG